MNDNMKYPAFICRIHRIPRSTNGFSSNKRYQAIRKEGNGFIVINDNGHTRFILGDNSESPHIVDHLGFSCGSFERVENAEQ